MDPPKGVTGKAMKNNENEVNQKETESTLSLPEATKVKDTKVKETKVEETKAEETKESPKPAAATSPKALSSNAYASSASTNSFNVLTDRPTSRVSNPPGGKTSIKLW